jgi:hypothetical protein
MTMRYAHLSPDINRSAVKLLDTRRGNSVAAADPAQRNNSELQ